MKTGSIIIAAAALIMSTLGACSSSKQPVASYPDYTGVGNTGTRMVNRVEDKQDECELEALNAPADEWRAYGSAIDEDRDFARHQAVLFAKAEMISSIKSLTLNVAKGYRAKIKANGLAASEADIKEDAGSMAEQMLENCRIICSKRYVLSDGTYECVVCISVPAKNVEMIAGNAVLNDDARMKVEFDAKQFRDAYTQQLLVRKNQAANR